MKEWLNYFKIWFLVCGILLLCLFISFVAVFKDTETSNAKRVNKVCTETERVFDYADVLTDKEEDALRELIAEREKQTQCDIVLLIMNESLEDYATAYDPYAYGSDWAMIKADNFYDEYGFGWNKYQESDDGDGVLLLDNWYRESDGKIHTWLSTSGKAKDKYSDSMIDNLLDEVYEYDIETEPYKAYKAYVETFYQDMTYSGPGVERIDFPWIGVLGISLVAAIIFIVVNVSGKEGKKTVQMNTYLGGIGRPVYKVNENRFIRKQVTTRHIDRSSGSGSGGGGGGSHISAGGHSHGGGGHSR